MSYAKTSATKLQAAVRSIQKLYPISYADSAWDNTGLLVDASTPDAAAAAAADVASNTTKSGLNVLLTVDLTQSVVDEAIKAEANLVLAYHPFIFRGLKAITQTDPQQRSLIRLLQHGISVYCPHTAIDAAKNGVNDWLVDGITGQGANLKSAAPIEPNAAAGPEIGVGRLVELKQPISVETAVKLVKESLKVDYLQVATNGPKSAATISSVAICAGSGGSVFKGVDADLYYTGELSHHEALYFKESGKAVIAANHSNTERQFLHTLKRQLQDQFAADQLGTSSVTIATTDRDPYETM